MNEVCLSIKLNAVMSMALHIFPVGVSFLGMHAVYLHSVRLCALLGGVLSVISSLEVISIWRPSVYFVLTSPLYIVYKVTTGYRFCLFLYLFFSVLITCEISELLISDEVCYAPNPCTYTYSVLSCCRYHTWLYKMLKFLS